MTYKLFKCNLDKFHIRVLFNITVLYYMCDVTDDIKFDMKSEIRVLQSISLVDKIENILTIKLG